jgi:hypothetical protein
MLDRLSAPARTLLALIVGQICLHSCMAGVRLASPLLALRQGYPEWAVGVLLGLVRGRARSCSRSRPAVSRTGMATTGRCGSRSA